MMKSLAPREAIVLAGGFGTRLKDVVNDLPKPMAPVAGLPFLQHVFDYLIDNHIEHAIVAVGYLRNSIIDTFGNAYRSLKLTYSIEEPPLGTGGGIMQACKYLHKKQGFVINGDTYFNVNLTQLHNFHAERKAQLSMALKEMKNFDRYGTVEIDSLGKVTAFNEKKYLKEGLINGGVYCIDTSLFHNNLPKIFSFEKEILEKEFLNGHVFAKTFDGYFIDIGIPEDYSKAQNDFAQRLHV